MVISKDNTLKAVFDVTVLLFVGYSCVTCVFYAAFNETNNELVEKFDIGIEFLFGVDLFLNFFQTYIDPETNKEIRDHRKIANQYILRGWFFVDFISVFPFQFVFESKGELTKLFRLFRLPRLIKLIDISRFKGLLNSLMKSSD